MPPPTRTWYCLPSTQAADEGSNHTGLLESSSLSTGFKSHRLCTIIQRSVPKSPIRQGWGHQDEGTRTTFSLLKQFWFVCLRQVIVGLQAAANLNLPPAGVTHYYNGRGTAEQWIKEGKYALNWTRLSCHRFVANQVRLWLFVLAYNLGNFMRRLTLPESVKHWSLRSVQTKLIKMGGRLVRHARRLVFQLAEVAVSREVFRQVLERIAGLHPAPG